MPLLLIPVVFGGGLLTGWWGTTETVEAVTGGKTGRIPPVVYLVLLVAGYTWAKKKGYL